MGLLGSIGKAIGSIGGTVGLPGGSSISGSFSPQKDQTYDIVKRVKDAQRAGIHPLYAMNAPVYTNFGKSGGISAQANIPGQRSPHSDLQKQLLGAQIEGERAQTELTRARAAALGNEQKNDWHQEMMAPYQPGQITAEPLSPAYAKDRSGRLLWWRDALGKMHKVDPNQTPSEVLEEEFGEAGDWNAYARAAKAFGNTAWQHKGFGPFSAKDIADFLRRR